jgi:hypothetical protein
VATRCPSTRLRYESAINSKQARRSLAIFDENFCGVGDFEEYSTIDGSGTEKTMQTPRDGGYMQTLSAQSEFYGMFGGGGGQGDGGRSHTNSTSVVEMQPPVVPTLSKLTRTVFGLAWNLHSRMLLEPMKATYV